MSRIAQIRTLSRTTTETRGYENIYLKKNVKRRVEQDKQADYTTCICYAFWKGSKLDLCMLHMRQLGLQLGQQSHGSGVL
jgi:hypothetical protein